MRLLDADTLEWISNYKTQNSRDAARKSIVNFLKYLNDRPVMEYIDELKTDEKTMFKMINQFLNSLSVAPSSIRQTYSFYKSYLRIVHGIKIDIEDRRQFIKFDAIPKINRFLLTKEIIKDLCKDATPIHRAFYLIQTSSGMRASESLNSKEEYFDFHANPVTIHLPAKITKTKQDRLAFISREASDYLKKHKDEYFGKPKSLNKFEQYFYKLRARCGYTERYEDSINYKVNIHGMRAFFRTQAIKKNIQQDIAEELIGHSGYLKTYKRIDEKDLIEAYKKLEPSLKIFS